MGTQAATPFQLPTIGSIYHGFAPPLAELQTSIANIVPFDGWRGSPESSQSSHSEDGQLQKISNAVINAVCSDEGAATEEERPSTSKSHVISNGDDSGNSSAPTPDLAIDVVEGGEGENEADKHQLTDLSDYTKKNAMTLQSECNDSENRNPLSAEESASNILMSKLTNAGQLQPLSHPIAIHTQQTAAIYADAKFYSFTEFEQAFELWKQVFHHPFRVASSETLREPDGTIHKDFKYRYIVYHCAHYGQPRMRGVGKRPNQNYLPCGCRAMLRLNYNFHEKVLKITTLNDIHNGHEVTAETYAMLTKKTKKSPSSSSESSPVVSKKRRMDAEIKIESPLSNRVLNPVPQNRFAPQTPHHSDMWSHNLAQFNPNIAAFLAHQQRLSTSTAMAKENNPLHNLHMAAQLHAQVQAQAHAQAQSHIHALPYNMSSVQSSPSSTTSDAPNPLSLLPRPTPKQPQPQAMQPILDIFNFQHRLLSYGQPHVGMVPPQMPVAAEPTAATDDTSYSPNVNLDVESAFANLPAPKTISAFEAPVKVELHETTSEESIGITQETPLLSTLKQISEQYQQKKNADIGDAISRLSNALINADGDELKKRLNDINAAVNSWSQRTSNTETEVAEPDSHRV